MIVMKHAFMLVQISRTYEYTDDVLWRRPPNPR